MPSLVFFTKVKIYTWSYNYALSETHAPPQYHCQHRCLHMFMDAEIVNDHYGKRVITKDSCRPVRVDVIGWVEELHPVSSRSLYTSQPLYFY